MKSERFSWRTRAQERFRAQVWPVIFRLAMPAVWLRRRLRPHKLPLCRYEGTAKGGDQPLTLLLGGEGLNHNYFLDLAFNGEPRKTDLGRVRLMDVFQANRKMEKDAPMVVLETNQSLHDWRNDGGWFFIPAWVTSEVALPIPEKCLRHDSIKTTFRKIRKHGYEYEVTRDEERFIDFYNNMHLPYITKEFGNRAKLDSFAEKRGQCELFDLVLLRKASQPDLFIAGFLIIYEPAGARVWSVGVRDGNMEHVQEGVLAALYIFSFEHLVKNGHKRTSMGSSRPCLRDGVLKFKRKMAHKIITSQWSGFSLRIFALTPGTKAFLLNNPFIFRQKERLYGAVFTESALTAESVAQLDKDHYHLGLTRLLLYSFNESENLTVTGLAPELSARVEIRPAKEIISGRLRLPA